MYCHHCQRFTMLSDHLNETGKLNKLCRKCLKKQSLLSFPVYIIDNLEEIISLKLFPQSYILISDDLITVDYTFEEFSNDLSDIIFEKTGIKFR